MQNEYKTLSIISNVLYNKKWGSIINRIFLKKDILKMSFFYFMKILFQGRFSHFLQKMGNYELYHLFA